MVLDLSTYVKNVQLGGKDRKAFRYRTFALARNFSLAKSWPIPIITTLRELTHFPAGWPSTPIHRYQLTSTTDIGR